MIYSRKHIFLVSGYEETLSDGPEWRGQTAETVATLNHFQFLSQGVQPRDLSVLGISPLPTVWKKAVLCSK